jgi:hypothetical protein
MKAHDHSELPEHNTSSENRSLQKSTELGTVLEKSHAKEDDVEENVNILPQSKSSFKNVNQMQEDNFGVCGHNQYSFHTFNVSHLRDDNSFIDGSFNTMLNLNAELSNGKGSSDQLKNDFSENRLPSGYYKFRIFVPEKGELICKQHVIDLSSVKVISSTQNSLGKIFMPKRSYVQYLLENQKEEEDEKVEAVLEVRPNNVKSAVINPSIFSSFEKTSDTNTFDLEFKDGCSYSGQIIKHGYGTYKDSRGNIYEGDWNYDSKHGHGKQTFVADSFYKPSNNDSISSIEDDFYKKGGKYFWLTFTFSSVFQIVF